MATLEVRASAATSVPVWLEPLAAAFALPRAMALIGEVRWLIIGKCVESLR